MSKANERAPFEGDMAPGISLPATPGGTFDLKEQKADGIVLYFYPKDDTPGCTKESIEFTAQLAAFEKAGFQIVGVSPDPITKHDKFIVKHSLGVTLVADEELAAVNAYGVWVEKNMYGRKYMGVERSTFLISKDGKIAKIWRKVKVKGHVNEVLEAAIALG